MCNMTLPDAPAATATASDDFAAELIATMNHASTALMISVGHRTGLFDAMAAREALTSEEWAQRTELDERYVREWLGAMTTARIVAYDRDSRRYHLPDAHAALLGRQAPGGNFASMFQFIAVLGAVESRIVQCFRTGGGVPYEAYDRFHEVMAEESDATVLGGLEAHILPLFPGLVERLADGIDVVDVGCGSGRAMNRLAALYPRSRFTGYDLCDTAIARARAEASAKGLSNVRFETIDATTLDAAPAFDLAFTFDAIHDQAHPAIVLSAIRRLLRPGGVYVMQEIDARSDVADNLDHPFGPFVYTVSCMHCMTVSLAQGGVGLGAAWGDETARRLLADAGFGRVERSKLDHDIQNAYYVCRA